MSLLARLLSSNNRRLLALALVLAALGCRPSEGRGAEGPECLHQLDANTVEVLLRQARGAGAAEKEFAALSLEDAHKYEAQARFRGHNWGPVSKAFGASFLCYPTVEALVGYARAQAMMDTPRPTQNEALEAKVRSFDAAASAYRLAEELGERTGQSVPTEASAQRACVEAFLSRPDPAHPPCDFVRDALRSSNIEVP